LALLAAKSHKGTEAMRCGIFLSIKINDCQADEVKLISGES